MEYLRNHKDTIVYSEKDVVRIIGFLVLLLLSGCNSQVAKLSPISKIAKGLFISSIPAQSTTPNTPVSIVFQITDSDHLLSCTGSVSVTTDNGTLFPPGSFIVTGTAPNCSLAVTPGAGQTGNGNITVSVTNGTDTSFSLFPMNVTAQVVPAVLDVAGPVVMTEDNPYTFVLNYTDGNLDPALSCTIHSLPASISTVTACSCAAGTCTVTLQGDPNYFGSGLQFIYSVTDNDGASNTATVNFQINPVNDTPTITSIPDFSDVANFGRNDIFTYTITDVEDALNCVTSINATSSNLTMVANGKLTKSVNGSGQCELSIATLPANTIGTTTVTVVVTDSGGLSATETFTYTLIGWGQTAYLKPSNPTTGDYFGSSVSLDNDTLAVGSPQEDSDQVTITNGTTSVAETSTSWNYGAVYVYRRSGGLWSQEAFIKPNVLTVDDYFGTSVSVSRNLLAVGVPNDDSPQTTITPSGDATDSGVYDNNGAVYIFKRTGTTWAMESYIKAEAHQSQDRFGTSISLHNDLLAVGMEFEDSSQATIITNTFFPNILALESGATYLFRRNAATQTWQREAILKASNNSVGDLFGHDVSVHSNFIAVGAHQEDSNQTTITNGTTSSANNSNTDSGAVYIYSKNGSNWSQEAYIKAQNNNGPLGDHFGKSVSIDGERLAVGAPNEDSNQTFVTDSASNDDSLSNSGAVYVYKRTGVTWALESYIKSDTSSSNLNFGSEVAIKGETLVVGVGNDDWDRNNTINGIASPSGSTRNDSGAVHVYKFNGTTWWREAYIKPSNPDVGDRFGSKISISGDSIAISAHLEDSSFSMVDNTQVGSSNNSFTDSGAVYVFRNNARLFEVTDVFAASSSVTATLDWNPTGGKTTHYLVKYAAGTSAPSACLLSDANVPLNTPSINATGLSANSDYTFRICATDGTTITNGKVFTIRTKSSGAMETPAEVVR